MQIEIETPRLRLKSITPQFIQNIFSVENEDAIRRYFNADDSAFQHLKSMNDNGMETHRLSLFYFLLEDKKTGETIGECGFHTWNKSHNRAELFYSLKNDAHKRQGLMTEALEKVLDYGFAQLKLHRIQALVAQYNTASVKLLEKFNFVKEGTLREDYLVDGKQEDSDCYSLLKHEWHQKKS